MDILTLKNTIQRLEERATEIAYEMIEATGEDLDNLEQELEDVENELEVVQTNLDDFEVATTGAYDEADQA